MHGMKFFVLAALFHMMHAPAGPANTAMLVDLVHQKRLPTCLPILGMMGQAGPIIGNIIGVAVVTLHMDNYGPLWLGMSVVGVFVLTFIWWGIIETLPEKDRKPLDVGKWAREYFQCFFLLKEDYLLMKLWWFVFFIFIGVAGWAVIIYNFMVGYLKFTTEEALLPGILQQFTNIISSVMVAGILPKIGGWAALAYGICFGCVECLFRASGGKSGIYIAYCLSSFVGGFTGNGALMLTSSRVGHLDQTKNQANVAIAANIGGLLGVLVWGSMYDATAVGLEAEKPMLYVLGLYMFATLLTFEAAYSEGWHFKLEAGDSLDTRTKFLNAYDRQGKRPPKTPTWLNAVFGYVLGSTITSAPGLVSKMMNCVFKTRNFVLKRWNFAGRVDVPAINEGTHCSRQLSCLTTSPRFTDLVSLTFGESDFPALTDWNCCCLLAFRFSPDLYSERYQGRGLCPDLPLLCLSLPLFGSLGLVSGHISDRLRVCTRLTTGIRGADGCVWVCCRRR